MNEQLIKQGDIYWFTPEPETSVAHPHVVIHVNSETVTVCALTSNISKVSMPGNLLLNVGDGNLSRQSVVEVSKVMLVRQDQLGDYIGTLSANHLKQILAGMRFVQVAFLAGR